MGYTKYFNFSEGLRQGSKQSHLGVFPLSKIQLSSENDYRSSEIQARGAHSLCKWREDVLLSTKSFRSGFLLDIIGSLLTPPKSDGFLCTDTRPIWVKDCSIRMFIYWTSEYTSNRGSYIVHAFFRGHQAGILKHLSTTYDHSIGSLAWVRRDLA